MADQNLGSISGKLYDLLSVLSPDDRHRVVQSALALFGEKLKNKKDSLGEPEDEDGSNDSSNGSGCKDIKDFFKIKKPEDRGEQLAVAARYMEQNEEKENLTKEDFAKSFKDAKRNFDGKNFARDISNAKNNAKFFISGGKSKTYKLSFYGEEYVDALPDREKAGKLKPSGKKPNSKKKKTKNTNSAKG